MIDNSMNLVPYNEKNEIVKAKKKIELTEVQKRKISVILHFLFELLKLSILFCLLVFILRNPLDFFPLILKISGQWILTLFPVGLIIFGICALIRASINNKWERKGISRALFYRKTAKEDIKYINKTIRELYNK